MNERGMRILTSALLFIVLGLSTLTAVAADLTFVGEGRTASSTFGEAPYCSYEVEMSDLHIQAVVATNGTVSNATLTGRMTERIVGDCPYQPISSNQHVFNQTTASASGNFTGADISIQFAGASANAPASKASFSGKLSNGKLVGTISIQRADLMGTSLNWTVNTSTYCPSTQRTAALEICSDGIDQDCDGRDSSCAGGPPVPPHLSYTTNGLNLSIDWTSVPGATGYTLYYAPYPYAGVETIGSFPMGTSTGFDITLWEGATYYIAVEAYNGEGASGYSNIELFRVSGVNADADGDGYSENQGDCDDGNGAIYPGATEICGDGIDQSCAGADLACPVNVNDFDRDGYTVAQGDCDDFNASVHPGGLDIANDGYDQDCDGQYNGDRIVLAPQTTILDAATTAAITTVSADGRVTFTSAIGQVYGLVPGDPLLIGITPLTPMGFMGKVVSIEAGENGQVIVITEPVALDEAFETLKIVRKGSLGAQSGAQQAAGAMQSRELSPRADIGVSGVAAYDDCVDGSMGAGFVNEFCVAMQAGYSLDIDIGLMGVNRATFTVQPSAVLTYKTGFEGEFSVDYEKEFPDVRYAPLYLGVPGLVLTPVLGATLKVDVESEGEATINVTRNIAYLAELTYQGGVWTKSIQQIRNERNITHEVHANAEVSATLSPVMNFYINAVAGPYLQLDLKANAVADPCADPWLRASLEAGYSIGAKVNLLKDLSYEFNNGVAAPAITWQSQGTFPFTGSVYGFVRDQEGNPIEGVTVDFLQGGDVKASTQTTATGSYRIDLAPCTYDVKFTKCGVERITRIENIVAGTDAMHNTTMQLSSACDNDGDGFTMSLGDCDDNDTGIHPNAQEICGDGIDQDCSGNDQACDQNTIDNDGDGYSEVQGDCDDSNVNIRPGTAEICGDGIDQDCSGSDQVCNQYILGNYELVSYRGIPVGGFCGASQGCGEGYTIVRGSAIFYMEGNANVVSMYIDGNNPELYNGDDFRFFAGDGYLYFNMYSNVYINSPDIASCVGQHHLVYENGGYYCSQLPPGAIYSWVTGGQYSLEYAFSVASDLQTITSAIGGQTVWRKIQ